MSARWAAEAFFLFAGCALVMLSCLGLLRGAVLDRMHFLGPATVLAPWLIGVAVIIELSNLESVIKIILLTLVVVLSSPVLTHATGLTIYRKLNHHAHDSARDE